MISKLSYEKVRVIITSFPYPGGKKEKSVDLSNIDQVVLESIKFMRSVCQNLSPDLDQKISDLQTPTQSLLQMLNTKKSSTIKAKPSTIKAKPSTIKAKPSTIKAKPSTIIAKQNTDEVKPMTIRDHVTMQTNTNAVDSIGGVRVRIGGTLYYGSLATNPWLNKSRNSG